MTDKTINFPTENYPYYPMIAAQKDGQMVVIWQDSKDGSINLQRFTADGQKAGGEVLVATAQDDYSISPEDVIVLENGEIVLISLQWSEVPGDYCIIGHKFAQSDEPSNVFVDKLLTSTDGFAGDISAVDATPLPDGGLVVVWVGGIFGETSHTIYAQRYDANLKIVGDAYSVNSTTNDRQYDPQVITLENDRYMVVWQDASGQGDDDSETSIKAQVFANDGTQVGTEFLVNSSTDGFQTKPAIAQLVSGEFVVTWMDGDDFEISPGVGDSFEAYKQTNPSVLALEDGGFVLVWEEIMFPTPADAVWWINIQKFNSTGETVGDVVTLDTGDVVESSVVDLGNGSFAVVSSDRGIFTDVETPIGIDLHLFNIDKHLPIKAIGDDTDDVFIGTTNDNDTLLGYGGDDTLSGEAGNDHIAAGDGDDVVDGGDGNDLIGGGKGHDDINGGAGNDTIGSGRDNDTVNAGDGNDIVVAYFGDDVVHGGKGNDRLIGHVGNDHIIGGADNDTIGGGYGGDTIYGGTGDDIIGSGAQDDLVYGGSGNDFISGTNGHDTLVGSAGDDTIAGGDHNDVMTGGDGADVFRFRVFNSGTHDIITDFTHGEDILEMRGNFEGLTITDHADGIQIEKNGHVIVLEGIETLTEDDFNFV